MRFAVALCAFIIVVNGKREEKQLKFLDIFETCKPLFVTQDYNPNWMAEQGANENTTIYAPLISKGDVFKLTEYFYGTNDFEDLRGSHLEHSCLKTYLKAPGQFTLKAYNDKSFSAVVTPVANIPNTFAYQSPSPNSVGGHFTISLSDQKTYHVMQMCRDDGLGSFGVLSIHPTLSEGAKDTIKTHLRALGFKEENFLEIDYSNDCSGFRTNDVPKPAKSPFVRYSPFVQYPFPIWKPYSMLK